MSVNPSRDPEYFRLTVMSLRTLIRTAGPAACRVSGTVLASTDQAADELCEWLGEIAKRRNERVARVEDWQPIGDVAGGIVEKLARGKPQ